MVGDNVLIIMDGSLHTTSRENFDQASTSTSTLDKSKVALAEENTEAPGGGRSEPTELGAERQAF